MRTQLTVVGNLTNDPSTRWTKDGVQLAEFGLAHNNRRLDRATGLWEDREPTFYTVTCWRRLAEGVMRSLHKGDPVVVYGKFSTREYERTDGNVRSELRIEADALGPDLQWAIAAVSRRSRAASSSAPGTGTVAPALSSVADLVDDEEEDAEDMFVAEAEAELADTAPGGRH